MRGTCSWACEGKIIQWGNTYSTVKNSRFLVCHVKESDNGEKEKIASKSVDVRKKGLIKKIWERAYA